MSDTSTPLTTVQRRAVAELMRVSPESFTPTVLVERLHTASVVVGENFTYGHRAAGTVETLAQEGRRFGFSVEGVPLAPKARPTVKPESITTGEENPCSRFRSTSPVETTRSLGAFSGRPDSQALRSSSMRWQKPQPGFQNSTAVGCPAKSANRTGSPSRLLSSTTGASLPMLAIPRGA